MIWSGRLFFYALIVGALLFSCSTPPARVKASLDLIPQPQSLEPASGFLSLSTIPKVKCPDSLESLVAQWNQFLEKEFQLKKTTPDESLTKLQITLDPLQDFGLEGYRLEIKENSMQIQAGNLKGAGQALSSLKQLTLLNSNAESVRVPRLKIQDHARFAHRGMLLDCSRHFFPLPVIKKYLRLLSLYKMNVLHWHLTEDQAWRIAIDKYPKLIQTGSVRTEKDGSSYGGHYSKEDIREVVSLADSLNIQVIPEIEMPGHAQAAIASYPHLSCTGDSISVANDWGVFKDIYCAGNDSVFEFLEDVLLEVMDLFPSKYIHIGGDEAPKTRWSTCSKCQKRIREEGLKNEGELQAYFIARMSKFLSTHHREIIGWDEILEGGITPGASIQSWRGMEGGIAAVQEGHRAIMSPTSHAYFDYSLKSIDLQKVYEFNPVPPGLKPEEQELIVGGECNLWSERIPTEEALDAKTFPRILAMSEVLWSDESRRDFSEFKDRVQSHYALLDKLKVKYGDESLPLKYSMKNTDRGGLFHLEPYDAKTELSYRRVCLSCDDDFRPYQDSILLEQTCSLEICAQRNGRSFGDTLVIPYAQHLALGKKVDYATDYNKWYTGGGNQALLDGKLGTLDFRDGSWQGFWGNDAELILELDSLSISSVTASFFQYNNSWIYIPKSMEVETSIEGQHWEPWGIIERKVAPDTRGQLISRLSLAKTEARPVKQLKIKITNQGKNPDWHEAAGADAWIFIDEIIVQ